MGRFWGVCPGLAIRAAKVSLNWDQAMRPQGRMSPSNGSPGSSWLFTRNPWGLHTLLALSFLWSCASLRLLTYLQAGDGWDRWVWLPVAGLRGVCGGFWLI